MVLSFSWKDIRDQKFKTFWNFPIFSIFSNPKIGLLDYWFQFCYWVFLLYYKIRENGVSCWYCCSGNRYRNFSKSFIRPYILVFFWFSDFSFAKMVRLKQHDSIVSETCDGEDWENRSSSTCHNSHLEWYKCLKINKTRNIQNFGNCPSV